MRKRAKPGEPVPIALWGRDHWSTLLYAESRCVDHKGVLERRHMRVDRDLHPLLAHLPPEMDRKTPTRLNNGDELRGHDDYSCLEDMEEEGLLEIVSKANGFVMLCDLGWTLSAALRRWKAENKPIDEFPGRQLADKEAKT